MALTLTLTTRVLKEQTTAAGFELYEGGDIHDSNKLVGTFAIINNTVTTVTDVHGLDTAMVQMTLFFFAGQAPHGHGGGGGGGQRPQQPPENMSLLGANEFVGQPTTGQPRQTAKAIGSVAAASQSLASNIGKQFVRVGDKLTIG